MNLQSSFNMVLVSDYYLIVDLVRMSRAAVAFLSAKLCAELMEHTICTSLLLNSSHAQPSKHELGH